MTDEQDAKLRKIILDSMGFPFYENSVELTRLNENVKESMSSIIDSLRDEMCGNCEYSCNENNCAKRHNN